jgi:hypothetical protein
MTVHRLHLGLDKYPQGNALSKCVIDARLYAKMFGSPTGSLMLNSACTRVNILKVARETVKKPVPGDWLVLSYSGHGTQVRDRNKDESDGWDEALVSIDLKSIIDDLVGEIMSLLNPQAKGILFSDSCFSGTIQRAAPLLGKSQIRKIREHSIRYIPPSMVKAAGKVVDKGPQDPIPQWVVISGCTDFEFSYEGPTSGVMTAGVRKVAKKGMTVESLYTKMSKEVAKMDYPQHPQLSATKAAMKWVVPFV